VGEVKDCVDISQRWGNVANRRRGRGPGYHGVQTSRMEVIWFAEGMPTPMSGKLLGGVIAGGGAVIVILAYKQGRERSTTDKSSEYMQGGTYYELAWIGPRLTWK
jgi:hypothetical protein